MSTIAFGLLISAIRSIGDLEDAQRQLGAQTEKFHQYERSGDLTKLQNDPEYWKRLDELKSATFVPGTKSAILEAKVATSILLIYIQAVFFICVWVRKHQKESKLMRSFAP